MFFHIFSPHKSNFPPLNDISRKNQAYSTHFNLQHDNQSLHDPISLMFRTTNNRFLCVQTEHITPSLNTESVTAVIQLWPDSCNRMRLFTKHLNFLIHSLSHSLPSDGNALVTNIHAPCPPCTPHAGMQL